MALLPSALFFIKRDCGIISNLFWNVSNFLKVNHEIMNQLLKMTIFLSTHNSVLKPNKYFIGVLILVTLATTPKIWLYFHVTSHECAAFDVIVNLGLGSKNGTS